jgi:hypothetical protein
MSLLLSCVLADRAVLGSTETAKNATFEGDFFHVFSTWQRLHYKVA